jgi:hypothetical protein
MSNFLVMLYTNALYFIVSQYFSEYLVFKDF